MPTIDATPDILKGDPGNPVFADYADKLRQEKDWLSAIAVCLAGLSSNPTCHRGRLVLARVFFERGYIPFAAREVEMLKTALPELKSIERLYKKFYPSGASSNSNEGKTVAESDFDMSEIEMAGEDEE